MISSNFHITSDYLEEKGVSYDLTDWASGFDILLYNYEKENIALVAEDDISYKVAITGKWVYSDPNDGIFKKNATPASQAIHLTPGTDVKKGDQVTVTVTTTAPYVKTLSATFTMASSSSPSYTIKDQADGTLLLTIQSNDYSGNITVKWNKAQLDPDSTNKNMANWSDAAGQGVFTAEDNTTYQLLFFKNIADSFTDRSGVGTEISLTK